MMRRSRKLNQEIFDAVHAAMESSFSNEAAKRRVQRAINGTLKKELGELVRVWRLTSTKLYKQALLPYNHREGTPHDCHIKANLYKRLARQIEATFLGCMFIFLSAAIAHAQDRQCSPDDTLCVAEVAAARLSAANAKIASLTQINADQQAIIAGKDQLISIKNEIIANLQKMDTNSQRIEILGQQKEDIWKEQHFDDKKTIGDLQKDLASCRGNQKWIFAGGSLIGGFVGYKIKGNVSLQNPLILNPALSFTTPQEKARLALQSSFTK